MKRYMASACLAGAACRYNGGAKTDPAIRTLFEDGVLIPFCPEVLGGLSVPRSPMLFEGGDGAAVLDGAARVVTGGGEDRTAAILEGALLSAAMAEAVKPATVFLKARSPSCGCEAGGAIGVTAALLRRRGFALESVDPPGAA